MEQNSETKQSVVKTKIMDHPIASEDLAFEMQKLGPCQIIGKVSGTTEIIITNNRAKRTGSSKNPFFHYEGKFRSGDGAAGFIEATILAFDGCHKEEVEKLHSRLNLVSHQFVLKSLGYECGIEEHQEYIFLAFSRFEETFAAYMEKSCKKTMELGRFTEEFIALIECVVPALLALHRRGFYCPKLSARNIAVVKENNKPRAMLFDFQLLEKGNEKGKDKDWVKLGYMIKRTAENHQSFSPEIDDLFRNLTNGTLKGMDVLKHSALLSIRKKFQNILALNTFILTHCKQATQLPNIDPTSILHCEAANENNINATEQLHCKSSDEAIVAFKRLLDSDVGWTTNIPSWISKRITELGFKVPKQNTFREFVWQMRCLIEHENNYPTETAKKVKSWYMVFSEEQSDLESEIRKAWSFLFLNCQKFAKTLALKY